jgi:hypothetical protein
VTLIEFLHPIRTGKQGDLVLSVLYYFKASKGQDGMTAAEIKAALVQAKIPKAKTMNVNAVLSAGAPYVHAPAGKANGALVFELTGSGDKEVQRILNLPPPSTTTRQDVGTLQTLAATIKDDMVRGFIEEAILCLQANALRAAIVFVWSGAIRTLHEEALAKGEATVNTAISKRDSKARQVTKIEDFAWIQDRTFLDACPDMALLDRGQKSTLVDALNLRNNCGHPTQYRPGIEKARSFIEDVIGIVFK